MHIRYSVPATAIALLLVGCGSKTTPKGPPLVANTKPSQSLYAKYIKKPTGKNALEDYLKCMDQLQDPNIAQVWGEVRKVARNEGQGSDKQKVAEWAEGQSLIDLKRVLRDRAEKPLALIKVGNAKPIDFMNDDVSPSYGFERSIRMKSVIEQSCAVADANFADHRSAEATALLLDQLDLGHQMAGFSLINLLGYAITDSIVLKNFDRHMAELSADDCATIVTRVTELLSNQSPLAIALKREEKDDKETVKLLYKESIAMKSPYEVKPGDFDGFKVGEKLRALSPEQREQVLKDVDRVIDEDYKLRIKALAAPESKWPWPTDPSRRPSGLVGDLAHFAFSNHNIGFEAEARHRTQLRLLRLHAAIQAYRLKNGRLPSTLNDLGRPDLLENPLVAGGFTYGFSGSSYALSSQTRHGGRGPIELTGAPRK